MHALLSCEGPIVFFSILLKVNWACSGMGVLKPKKLTIKTILPVVTTMSSHLKTMTGSVKIGCRNMEMSLFWSIFCLMVMGVVVVV